MKSAVAATLSLLVLLTISIARSQDDPSQRRESQPSPLSGFCPFQTPEEWQEFLAHYAGEPKWVETCEDSTCDAAYFKFVKDNIQSVFERCDAFFRGHESIDRCTANMRRFTPFWLKQHDLEGYGFNTPNPEYLAAQTAADKPRDMMKIPQAIVDALPYRDDVERAARENGLQYLTHDSAIDGIRTYIFFPDPQGRYDKWMLLNLKGGKSAVQEKTQFSILAVQKKDRDGEPLPRVRLHFRDYTIAKVPGTRRYRLDLNTDGNGKCFSCHVNGARQLIPIHTAMLQAEPVRGEAFVDSPDFAYERLQQFNRKLRSYGTPDWAGNVKPEDLGPALGARQSCTDCHNDRSRARLTVFASTAQIEQKMYKELSMPPDTRFAELLDWKQLHQRSLSGAETAQLDDVLKEARGMHAALARDFEDSRLPALKQWFLETPCR